jgi:hypothetical protein
MGEELGVTMPRFVSSWLASLGPVAGVMSMAFAPIAVIGLIEVLEKIPGTLQKGIDWLEGWTKEAKKAFQQTEHDELEWEMRTIRMDERLRAIALIGKEGMDKWHLAAAINSQDYAEVKNKITELNQALIENAAIAATAQGAKAMIGEKDLSKLQYGPTSQQIEQAKTNVKELEAQLDDLNVKSKELPAEAGAAAAKFAAEWQKSIQEQTEKLAAEAQKRIVEQLKAQREEEENASKHREKLEEESEKVAAEAQKRIVDGLKAQREGAEALREQLAREDAATLEGKEAAVNAEIALERDKYAEEGKLSTTAEALLEQLRQARLAKLRAESGAAYAQQMAALGEHLQQIERAEDTSRQRIEGQYAADVAKFKAAEEKKTLSALKDDEQRTQTAAMYAAARAALYQKEQTELQALANSQGWQGVFGSKFAELLRGDEALMKEWSQSSNQSAMMVRVTLEGLKETGEKTFESLGQGMAANIASAVVHSKSIKEAMRSELESVLENLSAQAITYAIYSTALGFTDLAQENVTGAAAAFEAAAIWGSVGAAAAVAGRAAAGGAGVPAARERAGRATGAGRPAGASQGRERAGRRRDRGDRM